MTVHPQTLYDAPLMLNRLAVFVEPLKLAEEAKTLAGQISLEAMERLMPLLHGPQGQVNVVLTFGKEKWGLRYVMGTMETVLVLLCQRCMEPYCLPVAQQFSLGMIVKPEDMEHLPEAYEPLVVTEKTLKLADMVEDELILVLPVVPRHEPSECRAKFEFEAQEQVTVIAPDAAAPFGVLASIKSQFLKDS